MSVIVHVVSADGSIDTYNTFEAPPAMVRAPEGTRVEAVDLESGLSLRLTVEKQQPHIWANDFSILDGPELVAH